MSGFAKSPEEESIRQQVNSRMVLNQETTDYRLMAEQYLADRYRLARLARGLLCALDDVYGTPAWVQLRPDVTEEPWRALDAALQEFDA